MDKKKYFLQENGSGYKCNENYLKKNNEELYNKIILNTKNLTISFKERIYLYINDLKDIPTCSVCNNQLKYRNTLQKGYGKYCSVKCMNNSEEKKSKTKITHTKKYGKESHNQSGDVKQKK